MSQPNPFRRLPPVHEILADPALAAEQDRRGRLAIRRAVRQILDATRDAITRGEDVTTDPAMLARRSVQALAAERPHLRPVMNATGVLLHTGLGRAPLAAEAAEAVDRVVRGFCNLEFDLDSGERGRRTSGVSELLRELTGAGAATVVNNNAAATVLALRALASGREVVVSRGQLVEIGGSFRLPEIFEVSNVRLREVGTTNKTRLSDYERALSPETAALLRVHTSNFRVVGFTDSVGIADLARLAKSRGLWCLDDIGSGALATGLIPGLDDEPTAAEGLAAGADLVLFSGDKLLGGPQCGILVGSKPAIDRVASDPLMRAVRVDKMTLAALEATLRLALEPDRASRRIPLWAFLSATPASLRQRAERLAGTVRSELGWNATAVATTTYLGGGSAPLEPFPSAAVRLAPPYPAPLSAEASLARALRLGEPAVVPRVQGGAVLLDLRTVPESDEPQLLKALRNLLSTPIPKPEPSVRSVGRTGHLPDLPEVASESDDRPG